MDALTIHQHPSDQGEKKPGYFTYLPVGFFGSASGIAGLGSAWRLASLHFGWPVWPSTVLAICGIAVFVAIAVAYTIKLITAPQLVLAEFRHPVMGSLFALLPIAFLLLPIPLAPYVPRFATGLWWLGAATSILMAWIIMRRWLHSQQHAETAAPSWIVAIGGPLNLPLAMPALGLTDYQELGIFALVTGLFFAMPVFTLIFSRLIFQPAPPVQARSALLILTAPFSIGYSAYVTVTGQHDLFSQALYMVHLFLLSVLLSLLVHLLRCCPFKLSWWSVSFPLAASVSASLRFAMGAPNLINNAIAIALLGLTTVVVVCLAVRTLVGIAKGELQSLAGP